MSDENEVSQKRKSLLQKAYDEGHAAYHNGRLFIENPYGEGLVIHDKWEQGWIDAKHGIDRKE